MMTQITMYLSSLQQRMPALGTIRLQKWIGYGASSKLAE